MVDLLIRKAIRSSCTFKVAAVGLDHRGRVVGYCTNAPYLDKWRGSRHAEARLMSKYRKRIKNIIIVRVGKDGELRPIDPCSHCSRMANRLGIRIVSMCPGTGCTDRSE